jgi:hypothetical protein
MGGDTYSLQEKRNNETTTCSTVLEILGVILETRSSHVIQHYEFICEW